MKNIFKFLIKNKIGEPPWEYYFLQNLDKKEYPRYLAKIFKYKTGEKLPLKWDYKLWNFVIDLKKCKTFNQKIQWIKLYGITPLMRECTDKVKVRDYVREKIGAEYLKPVLQVCKNFDEVNFEKLPDSFVIKCNHGCKWQFIIKNKKEYLNAPKLIEITKRQITGWLEQEFWAFGGFELQYKGIKPKILIEPLLRESVNNKSEELHIYCFNGTPRILIRFFDEHKFSIWNDNFNSMENIFNFSEINIKSKIDNITKQSFVLSKKLAKNFIFIRVDWLIYKNKLYFEELTFTPYSGLKKISTKINNESGELIKLK